MIKFNDANPQKYIGWYKIPNFSLQVVHVGFILTRNNFFFNILDQTVQKMLSAGLIDIIISECMESTNVKFDSHESSVFSLNSLSFGFAILFGCLGVCFCVFLLEIVIFKTIKWLKARILMEVRLSEQRNRKDATTQTGIDQDEIENFVSTLFSAVGRNFRK